MNQNKRQVNTFFLVYFLWNVNLVNLRVISEIKFHLEKNLLNSFFCYHFVDVDMPPASLKAETSSEKPEKEKKEKLKQKTSASKKRKSEDNTGDHDNEVDSPTEVKKKKKVTKEEEATDKVWHVFFKT